MYCYLKNFRYILCGVCLLSTSLLGTPAYSQNHDNGNMDNGFFTYDPFRLLEQFSTITMRGLMPRVDIIETPSEYIIKADVPGIDPANIEITINNNVLTISGKKNTQEYAESEGNYYKKERFSGEFSRQFYLPSAIDTDQISATNENGVLTITIPKQESAKPRTIEIQS